MNPNYVRRPEQIRFIMECRQSGLSDYQWCKAQNINPGTFYNWVRRLKKSGYTFPESESQNCGVPVKQEVVKLDLTGQEISASAVVGQNVSHSSMYVPETVAAEIHCGNITLRLFNGADTAVIQNTLKCTGGILNAR